MGSQVEILPFSTIGHTSTATFDLNASGVAAALIFRACQTDTIVAIGYSGTTTASPPTYDARIETLSARLPTGTLAGTGANATFTPPASTSNFLNWVTLGTPLSVTKGDLLSAVLRYSSGTIGTSNKLTLNSAGGQQFPRSATYNGTSWSESTALPGITVKYSDGTIQPLTFTSLTNGTSGFSGEVGSAFVAPFSGTVSGFRTMFFPTVAGQSVSFKMYASDGTTVLASGTYTSMSIVAVAQATYFFDSSATVTAGTKYFIVLTTGTGANVSTWSYTFNNAAERDVMTYGTVYKCNRATAGSGTFTETTTTHVSIVPVYDTVSSGSGPAASSWSF